MLTQMRSCWADAEKFLMGSAVSLPQETSRNYTIPFVII